MKTNWLRIRLVGLLFASGIILINGTAEAVLTTNSWFLFSGKWEDGTKWSAGIPSSDDAVNTITNDLSAITVTIDTATVTQHVINGCMTVSNLVVGRGSIISHTLFLNNANNTPGNIGLTILNAFTINATGVLSITNSNLRVSLPPNCGNFVIDGSVLLNTGTVIATNGCTGKLYVGETGVGTLTVSNGTLIANDVAVADGGGSQGTLTIAGGTSRFVFLSTGLQVGTTGTVWLTGGQLTVSNETTVVGGDGVGQMTVSNGTWAGSLVTVGNQGTLTIAGGTNKVSWLQLAAGAAGTTGTVWMTGGSLAVTNNTNFGGITNNPTLVGVNGVGQMTVSNGTFLAREMYVGTNTGSVGTFTAAGGTNTLTSILSVGGLPGATGAVWMTDGRLIVTNAGSVVLIGSGSVGQMTVSNGTWLARDVRVGNPAPFAGSQGSLTFADGFSVVSSNMTLGNFDCTSTGIVNVTGGSLFVTGTVGAAKLEVRSGTFTQSGGLLTVRNLVLTNACGRFLHTGGTLTITGLLILDPNLDADGDGIPNNYELFSPVLDQLNPNDAGEDPDGDGFTNLQEYLAGTDPADANSTPFCITAIERQGVNMLITWMTTGGKTNRVQFTAGSTGGSYSNNFTDLSPIIVPTGNSLTTTNYLDGGGATNKSARYYRVRLVP